MKCPLNYVAVVQKFSSIHKGVDFGWYGSKHHNQPVFACDDGVVIYNRYQKTGGYVIHIRHDNGYVSEYGHLLKDSQTIHEGDKVKKGQQIAQMGASGKVTGEHLHFGLYKGKKINYLLKYKFVDPLKYINLYDKQVTNEKSKNLIRHTKKVTAEKGLNIRNKPNVSGDVVKVAKYNSQVEVYGTKNKWNVVDNIRGYYCSNNYLK